MRRTRGRSALRKGVRMLSKSLRETLAVVGVIGSMAFVGMQIRESNIQARAAAYSAIGIATSDFTVRSTHTSIDS
jgi:hypothetical protein